MQVQLVCSRATAHLQTPERRGRSHASWASFLPARGHSFARGRVECSRAQGFPLVYPSPARPRSTLLPLAREIGGGTIRAGSLVRLGRYPQGRPSFRMRAPARRSQARSCSTVAARDEPRATSTRSTAGRDASSCRIASRRRRLMRLRTTESPTFDETASPTRATAGAAPGGPARVASGSRGAQLAARGPSAKLCPRPLTARYSDRRRSRADFGNDKNSGPLAGCVMARNRNATSSARSPRAACGPWRGGA